MNNAPAPSQETTASTDLLRTIAHAWGWTGIEPAQIIGENDFGNWIIIDTQGSYWRICPEDLACHRIAGGRAEFETLAASIEFQTDWQMKPLIAAARAYLGPLQAGQKFHLIKPAALGGGYDVTTNVSIIDQLEQLLQAGAQARDNAGWLGRRFVCFCGRC